MAERIPSEKAPAATNDALIKRVKGFYQAHVEGKFRQADQFVAEESKEDYFVSAKQRFEGFDIMKIGYFENFNKAEVTVSTKGTWMIRGEKLTTNLPATTYWKLVNGDWFWYVDASKGVDTPFGKMHFDSGAAGQNEKTRSPLPGDPLMLAKQILNSVKVDKDQVTLSSFEPATAEVKVTNGMAGAVTLYVNLDGVPAEVKMTTDHLVLAQNDVATIKLAYSPKDKAPKSTGQLRIRIDPLNMEIPVKILFAVPADVQKAIDQSANPKK